MRARPPRAAVNARLHRVDSPRGCHYGQIFRELAAAQEHPDAETLFRAVQHRMPTVSLDTVYRTLWMLHRLGLVTTLGPRRDGIRFDANLAPHHHYVCVGCGLVRDFESAGLVRLPVPETVRQFGSIAGAHVEVRGLCTKCLKQRKPGPPASRAPARRPRPRGSRK